MPTQFDTQRFAPAAVQVSAMPGGGWTLQSPLALPDELDFITDRLRQWASRAPERPLISERRGDQWQTLTYEDVYRRSGRIAHELLRRGLSVTRPLMLIGEASIEQFLLRTAALLSGIPFVPVSPALIRHRSDERFRAVIETFNPGMVVMSAAIADECPGALFDIHPQTCRLGDYSTDPLLNPGQMSIEGPRDLNMDSVAAYFLTSGSTGAPKAVPITHRMISVTQASYELVWPFLHLQPPVLLDWLPWHHTFGGNDNIHKIIWTGGSYYIDDGRPTPELIDRTIDNIRQVRPTIHINVPKGIKELLGRLEADEALFHMFYERLDIIFFAAAGLDNETWRRLNALNERARSLLKVNTALVTGCGTTETGSIICLVHFPIDRPSIIGLPVPGMEVRLVPDAEKFEVRVKSPAVMPAYFKNPQATVNAFDEEGYYRTGDAALFFDPDHPERGLLFDGRLSEDFKLATGTWVSVGPLRTTLLALLSPLVRDVLLAGRDREAIAIIVFLDEDACRKELSIDVGASPLSLNPIVQQAIRSRLQAYNRNNGSSSKAVAAAIIDDVQPDRAAGEITDKGSVNQRLALSNRAALVDLLYAAESDGRIIRP
ncbi:AMP-binding protein [Pseudochelatococcus sp. B33]